MPSFGWGTLLASSTRGTRKQRKKRGGAALGKRGNQSYRSPAHRALIDTLSNLRKNKKISLKVAASRLPPWMSLDFTQLSRIFRLDRDVSYQEVRYICIALGSDIMTVARDTEAVLKASTLPPVTSAD